jgi:pimeloyl-ACP methyl ester carboxylesterase
VADGQISRDKLEMPKVSINGAEIYYESYGDGPPLVLIPGFASGAWSWAWQTGELYKNFRVITFDPRGIASSPVIEDAPVSIGSIADDVAGLLESLGIIKASVLGVSFGGFVAQEFALKYPALPDKLILASTSFGGPNHVLPAMDILTAFASTVGLNSGDRIRQYMKSGFSPEFIAKHEDEVERFCALREQNSVPESIYLQQLQSATVFNAESRVPEIAAETLVVSGDTDRVVPVQNSINLAGSIPDSRLDIIENGSHLVAIEQPAKFNAIVTGFLTA